MKDRLTHGRRLLVPAVCGHLDIAKGR
jgi:hypothetical protein